MVVLKRLILAVSDITIVMDMPPATSVFEPRALSAAGHEGGEHGHGSHDHSSWDSIWQEYLQLIGDPAHIMFEITATLILDLLFIGLIYGVLIRKFLIPKLRRDFHKEFDKEHGIDHTGHDHGADIVDEATEEREPK